MKKRNLILSLVLFGVLLFIGCSSTEATSSRASRYTTDLGTTTIFEAQRKTPEILRNRHQYQTSRIESSNDDFYYESQWRNRPPFEDEEALGIVAARDRIIVRGKPRSRGAGVGSSAASMNLDFRGETHVRLRGTDEWKRSTLTSMARDYLKRIADDLKTELDSGIRVY